MSRSDKEASQAVPGVGLASLTPSQRQAVEARGNVLVVAGAGTGKTSTLVQRALSLLLDEDVSLEHILMVTFTEAAAAEMRHRIRRALLECQRTRPGNEPLARQLALLETAQISTLHSFCLALVRQHFQELALDPQVTVLDEPQTQPIIEETFEALFADAYQDPATPAGVATRDLLRRYGGGSEERVRRLVLQLHRYTQSLPDPAGWFAIQQALFAEETPERWREWFITGFAEWKRLWRPSLEAGASRVSNIARCAAALDKAGDKPSFETAAAALREIIAAYQDPWERGTAGKFRDPIEPFFQGAVFLFSLTAEGEESDPLAQDWDWVRHPMSALLNLAREFSARFSQAKRDLGGVDFADLEQLALRLLWGGASRTPTALAQQLQERFQYVFVDECQDINEAQDAILRAVSRSGEQANRFLVGDVKQSIYRFRLARPDIFRKYEESWRDSSGPGRRLPLAENFRSREAILVFVNRLFGALMRPETGGVVYDEDAQLRFGDPGNRQPLSLAGSAAREETGPGPEPAAAACVELHLIGKEPGEEGGPEEDEPSEEPDEWADLQASEREARLVARRLRELKRSGHPIWDATARQFRPVEWEDMVVLLRAPTGCAEIFAKEFNRLGVPLQAARGGFYKTAEILDLLSLLQILDNPLQDVPVLAVLRSPLVGLSLDELAEIRVAARKQFFWTALKRWHQTWPEAERSTNLLWPKVDLFLRQYARWRRLAREASLSECLEAALAETHYEALLQAGRRGAERVANVRLLLARARQFDPCQRQGLFRFLGFVAAQQEAGAEEDPAPLPTAHAVRLMSIHQSKGLEFPVIVLAGLGTQFNLRDLRNDVLLSPRYGLAARVVPPGIERRYPSLTHWLAAQSEKQELLGEEMRLLYVAMTRARDTLLLTASARSKEEATRWSGGEDGVIPELEILQARCPLAWLRRWLRQAAQEGEWITDRSGENTLFSWRLYLSDDPAFQVDAGDPASPDGLAREAEADARQADDLRALLTQDYGFHAATVEPAKTSVTTLRRRATGDEESFRLDFRGRWRRREDRQPNRPKDRLTAAERGTAHHLFQQLANLDEVGSELGLKNEAQRLVATGQLSAAQAGALDCRSLLAFWQSDLGCRIRAQARRTVHREMPFTARFSAQDLAAAGVSPASAVAGAQLEGEFIVVQGTIDLAVIRDREIWLADFKTDQAGPAELDEKARFYAPQLKLYALALERIYGRPVTERWLHFLTAHRSVAV